ncbi:unnamed protein product [Echinostoma caproni]|uniref:PAS domain-containing protein n=1 Tax=Echinostoma caproni TaxID=27848 RepID=A0A183AY74_9TREM|nr:unnamed protein product [Echinostoma caproni]
MCRPLDPVTSTVVEPLERPNASDSTIRVPASVCQFTLRLTADTFLITEVVGDFQTILGNGAENSGGGGDQATTNLLNRHLQDIVHPSDRLELEQRLLEAWNHRRPVHFSLRLVHLDTGAPVSLEARLSPICLGAHLHCFVCRLTATETPNIDHLSLASCFTRAGGRLFDPEALWRFNARISFRISDSVDDLVDSDQVAFSEELLSLAGMSHLCPIPPKLASPAEGVPAEIRADPFGTIDIKPTIFNEPRPPSSVEVRLLVFILCQIELPLVCIIIVVAFVIIIVITKLSVTAVKTMIHKVVSYINLTR